MDKTHTEAVENYLKSIYTVQGKQDEMVATTVLAERLGVAPASVTGMVKKLADLNLVVHKPYYGVALTETGRELALRVIRHHRLVELYLVQILGVPWDQVHAQAESLEHVLSEDLIERIEAALGYPTTDPHGTPIPTREGEVAQADHIRLTELKSGQSALVAEVSDHDPDLLRYLADLGLYPGEPVRVSRIMPLDGSLIIFIKGTEHAIGPKVARHVFVTDPVPAR